MEGLEAWGLVDIAWSVLVREKKTEGKPHGGLQLPCVVNSRTALISVDSNPR